MMMTINRRSINAVCVSGPSPPPHRYGLGYKALAVRSDNGSVTGPPPRSTAEWWVAVET